MTVETERRGHVEIITIAREEARNALDLETAEALESAYDAAETDDDVRVMVLTGAGDRAFCAGMDLKAFMTGELPITKRGGLGGTVSRDFEKPLVVAANGHALAGGFELMLAADLAVAAEHATFGIPEVKRGLMAAAGGLFRLPKRISLAVALELAMTGEAVDAERALELGLVNRVVPGERVLDEALGLAELICANAPLAVRLSRRVVRAAPDLTEEEAWRLTGELSAEVFRSEDAMEGPRAFAEKREPEWKGR